MATTTQTRPSTRAARAAVLPGRQRRVSWMVAGVLLVVGCALAFALVSLRTGAGQRVLVVNRAVPAGHVLTAADLRTARLSAASDVQAVPAADEGSVVGRPVAVPLLAGALLDPADIGTGSGLPAGFDAVAAALKAGAYPPDLAAGDTVRVVPVSGSAPASAPAGAAVEATVLAVGAAPDGSTADAVVSLQVPDGSANQVAAWAAAGQVSLVQLPNGPKG